MIVTVIVVGGGSMGVADGVGVKVGVGVAGRVGAGVGVSVYSSGGR